MKRGNTYPPPCPPPRGYCWTYEEMKANFKEQIDLKKPDILITFTPYGYMDGFDHAEINQLTMEIWDELTWEPKPKVYWFVNTDQGPRYDKSLPPPGKSPLDPGYTPYNEHLLYPPTDVLDLDVYSEALGKTFWEAKLGIWEHYRDSIPPLDVYMDDFAFRAYNDRKEYFYKVDLN
jgi:hypothetical protein